MEKWRAGHNLNRCLAHDLLCCSKQFAILGNSLMQCSIKRAVQQRGGRPPRMRIHMTLEFSTLEMYISSYIMI